MYACLAVTCHLHLWQNDRDFLRVTVVTRGWNGYRNKSQHRKSTLEKKILPPFQQGFEPATFQSRVRRSNHWAIPAPGGGGWRGGLYTYHYTVTSRMTPTLKMGSGKSHFKVSLIARDKVTRPCPQTAPLTTPLQQGRNRTALPSRYHWSDLALYHRKVRPKLRPPAVAFRVLVYRVASPVLCHTFISFTGPSSHVVRTAWRICRLTSCVYTTACRTAWLTEGQRLRITAIWGGGGGLRAGGGLGG